MSQYYFLVASLPLLSYEQPDAADPDAFLGMLGEHLTEHDLAVVAGARLDAPIADAAFQNQTIRAWERYERGLRNALVRLRAPGRSADPSQYVRADQSGSEGNDASWVADAAREALGHESPLGAEHALNRARWSFLDEIEVGHYFDLHRVIVYYLKLQILARRRLFDRSAGEAAFVRINETIMNDYYQEQSE